MKEKLNESFMLDESFIQEEEFEQKQENEYADNLQMNLQKQQDNLQQNAQKSGTLQATPQEMVEQKISDSFPITKENVNTPEGPVPVEPQPVVLERKYEAILGKLDKDYNNVMETWGYYQRMEETREPLKFRIKQLEIVDTNASRYTRWKIGFFMNKKSEKFARFQQISDMKNFARAKLKQLRAEYKIEQEKEKENISHKGKIDYEFVDRTGELINSRPLPAKMLFQLTGGIIAGLQKLGRKIFALQADSNYRENSFIVKKNDFAEKTRDFLLLRFKKDSVAAKNKRIENEDDRNELNDYGSDQEFMDYEQIYDTYESLVKNKEVLLAEYQKRNKDSAKIEALQQMIEKQQDEIDAYNKNVEDERFILTTNISDELDQKIKKVRFKK
ncbi:MAG: hypothetical protein K5853_00210 [Lachnospiraceae bacterium]|nr:hypothetical protein [Lachnospiraceae bacterium]